MEPHLETTWHQVDAYLERALGIGDEILAEAVEAGVEAGFPQIQVSATQGKLLHLLARAIGANRILEIGTLAGYSGIWLARSLGPGGKLVTVEVDSHHAEVARSNFERAGVADKVDLRIGAALDVLPRIAEEGLDPFDLSFIDADKANNRAYAEWAVQLSRPGALVVVDNVVRGGSIVGDAGGADIDGTRAVLDWLGDTPLVETTAIQTVGAKNYDGFAVGLVVPGNSS